MPTYHADRQPRPRAPGELLQVGADNPAASRRCLRKANRLMEQQEYDQAEPILRRLVVDTPRDPEPLASLAICVAAGRGQLATAEKIARRARSLAPKRGCGWFALGYVNLMGSRIERGWRYLDEGRRRDPNDPRLQWGLDIYEDSRPGMITDLPRQAIVNRMLDGGRCVVTNRRVMMASAVYACYRAASVYFCVG